MFTGLVTEQGELVFCEALSDKAADTCFGIKSEMFVKEDIKIGSSVLCSGVCLTLTKNMEGVGFFDVSAETLRCTTLGNWCLGDCVNLERSLRMGDELGGHLVSGHVDGVVRVVSKQLFGGSYGYVFETNSEIGRYIARKGSVGIDGISLTVNEVLDKGDSTHFEVTIIPHTHKVTTISLKEEGSECNIEVDMLMRYVARLKDVEGTGEKRW